MEHHQHAEAATVYACPMHPEVTGKKGDKCPTCGMDLEPVKKDDAARSEVTIASTPQVIEAGQPVTLKLSITQNGEKVTLDIAHEMKVHLLLVNEELTWFHHIHPQEQPDGSYVVTETFPGGGKYWLFTDYKPAGGSQNVNKQAIEVKGAPFSNAAAASTRFVSTVDGYTVSLQNGNDFKTNRTQALQFTIEKNGSRLAARDIENYLGASAHIVMIGKADKDLLHIHPVASKSYPIYAETHVDKPGIYRMWVQFQVAGKVRTADFTVDVQEGASAETSHDHHGHNH
ncbi:heavy metal-binding domain-containing protein [Longitalea luteola]|uniref:heavy metal-binding domain-containing protein n=1 Tax=Longitalea luteola TaxID=2812563 RepID=UPI001A97D36E|nr:heavy metal-binding domain-containing protein [Longitalea luteola]